MFFMKKSLSVLLIFGIGILLLTSSCSSAKKSQTQDSEENQSIENQSTLKPGEIENTIVPDTFVLPLIPDEITDSYERAEYVVLNYWNRFDFTNRDFIDRPDITEQAFVDYINLLHYVPDNVADKSLQYTINMAEADTVMYKHFGLMFEKYLYDPNSPFRNEEYYIPVLQELVNSSLLSDEMKSVYQFQLDMVLMNRVGQKANNFSYTLDTGQSFKLYDLQSQYTLLMFSNPGCSTCEMVTRQLNSSQPITSALSMNSPTRTMLIILTIYPDDNLDEWHSHLPSMPSNWLHAFDQGMQITNQRLYDIKAFPTLYLLDENKRVLLKDTSIEEIESFFSIE